VAEVPRVVAMAREFKADLARRETTNVAEMATRYRSVVKALESSIEALAARLAHEAELGVVPTKGALYRMNRYAELQAQMAQEMKGYNAWAKARIEATRHDMAGMGVQHADALARASGLRATFDRLPAANIEQMVAQLQADAPLGELLVKAYGDAADEVANRLLQGVTLGQSPRAVAENASNALGIQLDRAMTIARTETLRAYREPQLERFTQLGITEYKRIATHDELTCIGCLVEDGEVYSTPDGFDAHPNCRCTAVPIVPGAEAPTWQSSEEWFSSLDAEQQLAMMGPGRYELWSSGAVNWADMSARTWNDTWGGAIGTKSVDALRTIAEAVKAKGA
jgi:SPP1 gp7 family putative phage head morphogenesis protein